MYFSHVDDVLGMSCYSDELIALYSFTHWNELYLFFSLVESYLLFKLTFYIVMMNFYEIKF